MQYRKFGGTGNLVSALGFGAMRLPVCIDSQGNEQIDEKEAIHMIRTAIDGGVNYVDTAYPYHNGQSEIVVGKALKDGYRQKVFLATKLPIWAVHSEEDFDRLLQEQLKKLDVDYIDYYLLHALSAERMKNTVNPFHLIDKMKQAKAEGKIKHIGFSFHDEAKVFREIVDCTDAWEFCQIQMNYIDIHNQATLEGMEYAASKGLGVIIMEPLLGGKLAAPAKNVREILDRKKEPVEWAFDFLWNRPEVSLLLSGMSTLQQVEDNLTYADRSSVGMLQQKELEMLGKAKEVYDTMALVSCTKCEYCMPCPFGLQIPKTFEAYNRTATAGMEEAKAIYNSLEIKADACRKCHKCEGVCPQHLKISEVMEEIVNVFA